MRMRASPCELYPVCMLLQPLRPLVPLATLWEVTSPGRDLGTEICGLDVTIGTNTMAS